MHLSRNDICRDEAAQVPLGLLAIAGGQTILKLRGLKQQPLFTSQFCPLSSHGQSSSLGQAWLVSRASGQLVGLLAYDSLVWDKWVD